MFVSAESVGTQLTISVQSTWNFSTATFGVNQGQTVEMMTCIKLRDDLYECVLHKVNPVSPSSG